VTAPRWKVGDKVWITRHISEWNDGWTVDKVHAGHAGSGGVSYTLVDASNRLTCERRQGHVFASLADAELAELEEQVQIQARALGQLRGLVIDAEHELSVAQTRVRRARRARGLTP
jgi:hypothetical protein